MVKILGFAPTPTVWATAASSTLIIRETPGVGAILLAALPEGGQSAGDRLRNDRNETFYSSGTHPKNRSKSKDSNLFQQHILYTTHLTHLISHE